MVLVLDIEVVEYGKVVVCWLRALVRLYLVKCLAHILANTRADVWERAPISIRSWRHCENWKACLVVWGLASGQDELPYEIVERYSQVVKGIANDRAQNSRGRRHLSKPEEWIRWCATA